MSPSWAPLAPDVVPRDAPAGRAGRLARWGLLLAIGAPSLSRALPSSDAAAGSHGATATAARNLLANAGFEAGPEGWTAMAGNPNWGPFTIADFPVHSGLKSARLLVESPADAVKKVKVYGVVQELRNAVFPDVVSGWYRVEAWEKSAPAADLYLQAVVIVWGDPRAGRIVEPAAPDPKLTNYQIRYYLAGLTQPPFTLKNARLKFVAKGPPRQGEWVRFEIPVKKDFLDAWGVVPEGYEFIRVLFEARWDNLQPGVFVRADVYYDDLYVGPSPAPAADGRARVPSIR